MERRHSIPVEVNMKVFGIDNHEIQVAKSFRKTIPPNELKKVTSTLFNAGSWVFVAPIYLSQQTKVGS